MGVGALATIAAQKPSNLSIIVLDNEHFGETGMQKSHTSHGVDLAEIAKGCGFLNSQTIYDYDTLNAFNSLSNDPVGPRMAVVKITSDNPPRALPNVDGIYIKTRFRQWLCHHPN